MTAPRRERKVVTVLFCDLVGFTSRAEALEPDNSTECAVRHGLKSLIQRFS